jgi:hypothetical protein
MEKVSSNLSGARVPFKSVLSACVVLCAAAFSRAGIVITEVDPSGSSATSNTYNADWFELTNTGISTVDMTGWKMDDNSHTFTLAVPLRGVTSIAAGQTVVFIEGLADGSTDTTIDNNFKSFWFGNNVPAGLTIGNYGGSGVGLSQSADEVNIYDAGGNQIVGVGFGASTLGVTFDNTAGIGSSTQPDPLISTTSMVGVNGAFASANAAAGQPNEIGSPGVTGITPEPGAGLLLGLGAALLPRRRFARGK